MAHADFIHLRVHSAYSLLEGAIPVARLAGLAREHRMPALAVTDTANLFGALEFTEAMREGGIQPIVGTLLPIRREEDRERNGNGNGGPTNGGGSPPSPDLMPLLVQDEAGYRNLAKLSSRSYLETTGSEAAQVPLSLVAEHAEGLIALTGGTGGAVGRLLLDGQDAAAEAELIRLKKIFPDRLYVELMRHGLAEQAAIEGRLVDLAYAHDIPLVATNDVFFENEEMFEAHDALICVAQGAYISESDRRRLTPEHRFKSPAEMRTLFADLPEAADNTLVVAQRCAFGVPARPPIFPPFQTKEGRSEADEIRAEAREGLARRLESDVFAADWDAARREETAAPYRERLEYELGVITNTGFSGYFLIVADFIGWAKANGVPVGPGRGSGASSAVAWALGITDVDPLRFGLLFERFLNPERISMPDFDIDFCQDKRDRVIRYVQDKYGHDRVAQIITFGKLQARAVLRDVGRVLELPYGQVDRLCKMVPNNPANPVTLPQAVADEPRLAEARDADEEVARLLDIGQKLEGLYRHASTHAAGIVIGDRPLEEIVPVYRDPRSDMLVTQFNMKWVEQAGLVKIDFLGLKTLTVIDRAQRLIRERGIDLDVSKVPLDDPKTYELLSRGETVGVFQFDGSGMRDTLRKLKPDQFEEIVALSALYRPGPMDNIPKFIAVKHGEEKPDYLHESLKPILRETNGIIVYQEQVMQIAQTLSGYTLGEADILRRAMGKKIKSEMDQQRERFVEGAVARDVAAERASTIFDLVAKFAGYGFNKTHSTAYGLISYQTAYLKANYPLEFLAASMTLDMANTDKLNQFRQEMARLGLALRPPDINRSGAEFTVEEADRMAEGGGAVRYALAALKNVGRQAMEAVVAEREANGPFRDLFDFAHRIDPRLLNKRQIETLARAGAFDSLNRNRAQAVQAADLLMRHAAAAAEERHSAQASLFGEPGSGPDAPPLPEAAEWPAMERLKQEFEAVGFYLSGHPIESFGQVPERLGAVRYDDLVRRLMRAPDGAIERAKIACTVVRKQERKSQRGTPFAFVQLSDPSGVMEVTMFSELLSASRDLLEPNQAVLMTVDAEREGDDVRLRAQAAEPLEQAAQSAVKGLRIFIDSADPVAEIRSILSGGQRGRGLVHVIAPVDEGAREAEIRLPGAYVISPALRAAVKAARGVVDVRDI